MCIELSWWSALAMVALGWAVVELLLQLVLTVVDKWAVRSFERTLSAYDLQAVVSKALIHRMAYESDSALRKRAEWTIAHNGDCDTLMGR